MNIRISTILAVLLAAPVAAMAQNAPDPAANATTVTGPAPVTAPAHAGRHGAMMTALMNLDLSDDQRAQIKSIVKDFRSKNKGVTDPDTRKANMKDMRSQIEAILTPDQQTRLTAELKQMRADRRSARNAAPAASPAP